MVATKSYSLTIDYQANIIYVSSSTSFLGVPSKLQRVKCSIWCRALAHCFKLDTPTTGSIISCVGSWRWSHSSSFALQGSKCYRRRVPKETPNMGAIWELHPKSAKIRTIQDCAKVCYHTACEMAVSFPRTPWLKSFAIPNPKWRIFDSSAAGCQHFVTNSRLQSVFKSPIIEDKLYCTCLFEIAQLNKKVLKKGSLDITSNVSLISRVHGSGSLALLASSFQLSSNAKWPNPKRMKQNSESVAGTAGTAVSGLSELLLLLDFFFFSQNGSTKSTRHKTKNHKFVASWIHHLARLGAVFFCNLRIQSNTKPAKSCHALDAFFSACIKFLKIKMWVWRRKNK